MGLIGLLILLGLSQNVFRRHAGQRRGAGRLRRRRFGLLLQPGQQPLQPVRRGQTIRQGGGLLCRLMGL